METKTDDFIHYTTDEAIKRLQSNQTQGLTADEVLRRQKTQGFNEIEERTESLWHRLFKRFWGPIPWMIEIAALLSVVVQKWEDAIIISIMLLVNAGLDFWQEHRALNALQSLKARLAQEALVLRGGQFQLMPARELVPGDIIRLRLGNIVPADVKLIDGDYLLVDQASLTGESLPVNKTLGDVAYANTIIKQGESLAVVVNTGMHTAFASVVSLVAKASLEERSHFQKMVMQIGNFLIFLTLVLVLIVTLVSLFRGEQLLEIARFALVLTVASIPVALPAVLSITMAIGAVNLARRQAIVSRLTAIEELAGVDVFCSDKTGTLTVNRMEVADPIVLPGHDELHLFAIAALASRQENQDPIEQPLFRYLAEHYPDYNLDRYHQTHFVPFDPISKHTYAEISCQEEHFFAFKGAVQVLLDMSDLPDTEAVKILQQVDELAGRGYRTLAVGRTQQGNAGFHLLGLIPLFDPPREDSKDVISTMKINGIDVKMVTGDHVAIAKEVGEILGLEQETIRSSQLKGSGSQELVAMAKALTTAIYRRLNGEASFKAAQHFSDQVMETFAELYDTRLLDKEFIHTHESAIVEMIESVNIFAEVVPEDKYNIVDTLQKGGHLVAMTGDGVNDAPALKKADVGFAVSNATDAARAAADIILTEPGLSVINHAIEQARMTFERMKSYTIFRITETIRIVLFMVLTILVFNFYPITAQMIIMLALLNDLPILTVAYDHVAIPKSPVKWNMQEILGVAVLLGLTGVVESFTLFYILREQNFSLDMIRTFLFLKLVIAGHSTLFICRARSWFWRRPWPAASLFLATVGTEITATVMAAEGWLLTPIGWKFALLIWAYVLIWFFFNDIIKLSAIRLLKWHNNHSS